MECGIVVKKGLLRPWSFWNWPARAGGVPQALLWWLCVQAVVCGGRFHQSSPMQGASSLITRGPRGQSASPSS